MKLGRALMVLIAVFGLFAFATPADAWWHGRRGWGWRGPARVWWGPRWGSWGPRWGGWGPYGYPGYPYPYYGYPPPPPPGYAPQQHVYNGRRPTNDGGKETPTQGGY